MSLVPTGKPLKREGFRRAGATTEKVLLLAAAPPISVGAASVKRPPLITGEEKRDYREEASQVSWPQAIKVIARTLFNPSHLRLPSFRQPNDDIAAFKRWGEPNPMLANRVFWRRGSLLCPSSPCKRVGCSRRTLRDYFFLYHPWCR